MRFLAVFNRQSGSFRGMDLEAFCARATALLAERGHVLRCEIVSGGAMLLAALEAAAANPSVDVLIAGGGDGTASAAAAICFRAGMALAIVPAGTMNLFARSLRMPAGLDDAVRAIAASPIRRVDIATANGRPFIHQYSVGTHARLVRIREAMSYRSRLGKIWATVQAVAKAAVRPPRFTAEIRTASGVETRRCSAIVVSNNLFGEGHVPHADSLEGGVLGVYVAEPMSAAALARLSIKVMLGTWKASRRVSEREVHEVTLTFPRKKQSAVATVDGELVPLEARVVLRVHPGGLRVAAPAEAVRDAA